MAVRSDIDVCCADECNHLLRDYEAVMEDHVRLHSDFLRQSLQVRSIPVALAAKNMRVSRTCDYVNHVLVLRQDLRQCSNHAFDSLVWRKQTEREQDGLPLHAKAVLVEIRIKKLQTGNAMRNHVDRAARSLQASLQKLG